MSDVRATAARDFHERAIEAEKKADQFRARRDRLIRNLRTEDAVHWTYPRLAVAVGCSPELIAHIVKGKS